MLFQSSAGSYWKVGFPTSEILKTKMQRLNSPDRQGVFHFITYVVRDRKTPCHRPEYAQMLVQLLRYECDRHPAKLLAFVVMPDHLHLLLYPEDGEVASFSRRFKSNATCNLDRIAEENGRQKDRDWLCEKGRRELWQDGKHSLHIYSPNWIKEKVDYIHNNPVKNGLADNPSEYAL